MHEKIYTYKVAPKIYDGLLGRSVIVGQWRLAAALTSSQGCARKKLNRIERQKKRAAAQCARLSCDMRTINHCTGNFLRARYIRAETSNWEPRARTKTYSADVYRNLRCATAVAGCNWDRVTPPMPRFSLTLMRSVMHLLRIGDSLGLAAHDRFPRRRFVLFQRRYKYRVIIDDMHVWQIASWEAATIIVASITSIRLSFRNYYLLFFIKHREPNQRIIILTLRWCLVYSCMYFSHFYANQAFFLFFY